MNNRPRAPRGSRGRSARGVGCVSRKVASSRCCDRGHGGPHHGVAVDAPRAGSRERGASAPERRRASDAGRPALAGGSLRVVPTSGSFAFGSARFARGRHSRAPRHGVRRDRRDAQARRVRRRVRGRPSGPRRRARLREGREGGDAEHGGAWPVSPAAVSLRYRRPSGGIRDAPATAPPGTPADVRGGWRETRRSRRRREAAAVFGFGDARDKDTLRGDTKRRASGTKPQRSTQGAQARAEKRGELLGDGRARARARGERRRRPRPSRRGRGTLICRVETALLSRV